MTRAIAAATRVLVLTAVFTAVLAQGAPAAYGSNTTTGTLLATGTRSSTISPPPTGTVTFSSSFTIPTSSASRTGSLSKRTVSRSGATVSSSFSVTRSLSLSGSVTPSVLTASGSLSASSTSTQSTSRTFSQTPSASSTASISATQPITESSTLSFSESLSASASESSSASASVSTSLSESTSESESASASESTSASSSPSTSESLTESGSISAQLRSEFEKRHNPMYSRYFLDNGFEARRIQRRRSVPVGTPYHLSWRVKYRTDTQLAVYRTLTSDAASQQPVMRIGGQRCDEFTTFGHPGLPNRSRLPYPQCSEPRLCHIDERIPQRSQHVMSLAADLRYSTQNLCDSPNSVGAVVAIKGKFAFGASYAVAGFSVDGGAPSFPSNAPRALFSNAATLVDDDAVTPSSLRMYSAANRVAAGVTTTLWRRQDVEAPLFLAPAALSSRSLTVGNANGPVAPAYVAATSARRSTASASGNSTTNGTDTAPAESTAASAVVCELHDVSSYTIHAGRGIGATYPCTIAIDGGGSRTCSSVADYQAACDDLLTCTGFSSSLVSLTGTARSNDSATFVEIPSLLHIETPGFLEESRIPLTDLERGVLFYAKTLREHRRCVFPLLESGSVSLFLQQSFYATGYAQVFLRPSATDDRRVLVKQCGGTFGFDASARSSAAGRTSAFLGEDDSCGDYALCYETALLPRGMQVEVEVPSTMQQEQCAASLSVLAECKAQPQTAAGLNRTVAGLFGSPSYTPVVKSDMVGRQLRVAATSRASVTLNSFVYRAVSTALSVTQTVYDCSSSSTRSCADPAVFLKKTPLSGSSSEVLGACGGSLPFAPGSGLSGQCELPYDCVAGRSTFTADADSLVFTGLLQVTVNNAFVNTNPTTFSLPDICSNFLGDLYGIQAAAPTANVTELVTSSGNVTIGAVPVFPLVGTDGASSPPLLAITEIHTLLFGGAARTVDALLFTHGINTRTAASESEVALGGYNVSLARRLAISESATMLLQAGDLSDRRDLYYVDTATVPSAQLEYTMAPNISFACVVDSITANAHTCEIPMPAESNYVQVSVAQSDFASNSITVEFLDADKNAIPKLTNECGAQFGFLGFAGRAQECDEYLRCMDTFLPEAYSTPETRPKSVRITAPNTLTSTSCSFAMTALVDLSVRPFGSAENCTGYFCESNRKCIPSTDVCDGLRGDCSDLSDERDCRNFELVESNATINTEPVVFANVSSLNECRRLTVIHGAQGMTVGMPNGYVAPAPANSTASPVPASEQRVCWVWSIETVNKLLPAPSQMLSTVPESAGYTPRLYIRLDDVDEQDYGKCSEAYHCSSHGTLRNAENLRDGDSCVCECGEDFTGSACETLKSMGRAVSYVAVTERTEIPFVVAAYEDALAAGNKAITVAVGQFLPFNSTHRALPFVFTSFDSATLATFAQQLFTKAVLESVNARLDQLSQPAVGVVFGMDGLNSFFPVAACTIDAANGADRFACTASRNTPVGAVRISGFGITAFDVIAAPSAAADTTAISSRRQSNSTSNSTSIALNRSTCNGATIASTRTNTRATCYPTACMVDVDATVAQFELVPTPLTSDAANTTNSTATNTTLSNLTTCGAAASASVEGTTLLTLIDILAAAQPSVSAVAEDGFLFGAVGGISAVLICSAVIVGAVYWFVRWLREARTEVGPPTLFDQLKASGRWIADVLEEEKLRHMHAFDVEGMIVSVALAAVLLMGVMGLLWVLFVTSQEKTSNFDIVIGFYESSVCSGGASVKTLPYQLAALTATGECNALGFVGESDGTLYARGVCERSATQSEASETAPLLAMASVSTACGSAPATHVTPGACVPLSTFLPGREGYVTADCSDATLTPGYLASLSELNPTLPQTVAVRSGTAPENLVPRTFAAADGSGTVFAYPFVARSAVLESTSHDGNVVASIFSSDYYTGQLSTRRPVMQLPGVFGQPASVNLTTLLDLETSLKTSQANIDFSSNALRTFVPKTEDYPLGFIYNAFGTVNEVSGVNSGPGAHRYLHVAGGAFDVGSVFNDDTTGPLDGFTVDLWARFSTVSNGFVFAITDFYQDSTGASVILDKLRTLVVDGPETTKRWFDRSFHVYLALYVDAATESLSLAMASPYEDGLPEAESVTIAQWRLSDFGAGFVFNDQWHHLSFHFGTDNNRAFVIIGVDGATERFNSQYRKCLDRAPVPIRSKLSTVYISDDPIDASVLDGGVMYVGYFNGGVQGLTFTPSNLAIESNVRGGTREIRIDQAKRVNTYEMIFYALVVCAFFALGAIVVAIRNMKRLNKEEAAKDLKALRRKYTSNIKLFFGEKAPIAFDDAFILADVNQTTFSLLLDEIMAGPLDHALDPDSNKFVRALYLAKKPAEELQDEAGKPLPSTVLMAMNPSSAQWIEFLEAERIKPIPAADVARLIERATQHHTSDSDEDGGEEAGPATQGQSKPKAKAKAKAKPAKVGGGKSGGGGQGGGGSSSSKPPAGGGSQTGAAGANAVILTVLGTIQAASIYTSTWTLPDVYLGNMVPVLEIGSLDFFDGLFDNTLAAPLAQLALGLIIVGGVSFVFVKDDNKFYSNALRYQQRRDRAEKVEGALKESALNYLLKKVDPTFVLEKLFPMRHQVQLMEGEERAEIALFEDDKNEKELMLRAADCGLLVTKHEEEPKLRCTLGNATSPVGGGAAPVDADGSTELKKAAEEEEDKPAASDAPVVSFMDAPAPSPRRSSIMSMPIASGGSTKLRADPCPIETIPGHCLEHQDHSLQIVLQSEVFPYRNRRTCCAMEKGKRCGEFNGVMYACTHTCEDGNEFLSIASDEEDCSYAICERHMKLKAAKQITLSLKAALNKFFGKGAAWLFFYIVITVALAVYTPVMRTCLMILSCHPTFQCEFPTCWSAPIEQRFASAAYLSALMVLLLGIGFPFGFYKILSDRHAVLMEIFTGPSYMGRFMEPINKREVKRAKDSRIVTSITGLAYCVMNAVIGTPFGFIVDNVKSIVGTWRQTRADAAEKEKLLDEGADDQTPTRERQEAATQNPLALPPPISTQEPEDVHSEPGTPKDHPFSRTNPDGLEVESLTNEHSSSHKSPSPPPSDAKPNGTVSFAPVLLDHDGGGANTQDAERDAAVQSTSAENAASHAALSRSTAPLADAAENVARLTSTTVSMNEWQRFLMTDPSAMTPLYEQLKFESMKFVPVLNCAKFLLLVPPLLLEPNTIPQLGLIAFGEVTYAIVLAIMAPYVSVWMTLITLVGNIHQFLLVGLQAYFIAQANDKDLSVDVGYAMLAITGSYLTLILILVMTMILSPVIANVLAARKVTKLFARLGLARPLTAPLYISPFEGAIVIEENPAAMEEMAMSKMKRDDALVMQSLSINGSDGDGDAEARMEASRRQKAADDAAEKEEEKRVEAELAKWAATKAKQDKAGKAKKRAAEQKAAEDARKDAKKTKSAGVKAVAASTKLKREPSYARATKNTARKASVSSAFAEAPKAAGANKSGGGTLSRKQSVSSVPSKR